ncbi:MAG TPA: nicotinate phosphoribosyltransferase [Bryobacteraceae bacterium]|nr:nicotinate phosphoribosyltransferase [Bryobacteraceae bacterium]
MSALNTDLYELTMAAGYFLAGKTNEVATFELSVRRLPSTRNFLLAAGLAQAVEYLRSLHFEADEIEYLRSLAHFANAPPEFFDYLSKLRFSGDLFALPEGTPAFANEPLAIVRAPIIEAQLIETYLIATFSFQTAVASKAARCVIAANGKPVIEFGSRRAHSPHAALLAARAAYIGGCAGSSNTESGKKFGIPVSGTAAHSWTMSFGDEREAFVTLQELLGENTVFLLDTYDTIDAARLTAEIGKPVWGVRLDSGDLVALSKEVRRILDAGGLHSAKIFASNDLDEYRLRELLNAGAPIDAFGVGTKLATSEDAPSLSAVYKMVEIKRGGRVHYTAKFNDEKNTRPGAKQVYRLADHDILALQNECSPDFGNQPLVRPILLDGDLLEPLPTAAIAHANAERSVAALPAELRDLEKPVPYRVEVSAKLHELTEQLRENVHVVRS